MPRGEAPPSGTLTLAAPESRRPRTRAAAPSGCQKQEAGGLPDDRQKPKEGTAARLRLASGFLLLLLSF